MLPGTILVKLYSFFHIWMGKNQIKTWWTGQIAHILEDTMYEKYVGWQHLRSLSFVGMLSGDVSIP